MPATNTNRSGTAGTSRRTSRTEVRPAPTPDRPYIDQDPNREGTDGRPYIDDDRT